jgi:hypothetical protein
MLIVCRCINCQTNEAIFRIRKGEVPMIKGMTPMLRGRGITRFLDCNLLARNRGFNLDFFCATRQMGFVCVVRTLRCDFFKSFFFFLSMFYLSYFHLRHSSMFLFRESSLISVHLWSMGWWLACILSHLLLCVQRFRGYETTHFITVF